MTKAEATVTRRGDSKAAETESNARFVQYFGPLLDALRDLGGSGTPGEVVERIARNLNISEDIQNELTASGEPRFPNNVHWARFYLSRCGLIDSSRRGVWSLTDTGRKTSLTKADASRIFLKQVSIDANKRREKVESGSPDEQVAETDASLSKDYRAETLARLLSLPPAGFERLAQRLLREAGFIQVAVTGKSNDGGIDGYGTLQVNPLVSFKVLFQCKRYRDTVAPSIVRDFRGAMAGRADKGIIITTGAFTVEARREATRDGAPPIELIDGEKLIDLMASLQLGLRAVQTYELDLIFFNEFASA